MIVMATSWQRPPERWEALWAKAGGWLRAALLLVCRRALQPEAEWGGRRAAGRGRRAARTLLLLPPPHSEEEEATAAKSGYVRQRLRPGSRRWSRPRGWCPIGPGKRGSLGERRRRRHFRDARAAPEAGLRASSGASPAAQDGASGHQRRLRYCAPSPPQRVPFAPLWVEEMGGPLWPPGWAAGDRFPLCLSLFPGGASLVRKKAVPHSPPNLVPSLMHHWGGGRLHGFSPPSRSASKCLPTPLLTCSPHSWVSRSFGSSAVFVANILRFFSPNK